MCGLEFPDLEILDQQRDDLVVIGLAGSDNTDTIGAFIEQTGVRFPIAWDDAELRNQIAFPPAISPYPRQVLIDPSGRIAYVASEHSETDLREAVEAASQ